MNRRSFFQRIGAFVAAVCCGTKAAKCGGLVTKDEYAELSSDYVFDNRAKCISRMCNTKRPKGWDEQWEEARKMFMPNCHVGMFPKQMRAWNEIGNKLMK